MLNSCKDECQRNFQAENDCCPVVCNYRRINVIPQANETSRNATWNPVAGLVYAFMLSIGNDTRWTQTVSDTLNFCFNTVLKQPLYDICGIPLHLYDIINCAYNQLFLRCPVWNPSNISECVYTREFINICFNTWNVTFLKVIFKKKFSKKRSNIQKEIRSRSNLLSKLVRKISFRQILKTDPNIQIFKHFI